MNIFNKNINTKYATNTSRVRIRYETNIESDESKLETEFENDCIHMHLQGQKSRPENEWKNPFFWLYNTLVKNELSKQK